MAYAGTNNKWKTSTTAAAVVLCLIWSLWALKLHAFLKDSPATSASVVHLSPSKNEDTRIKGKLSAEALNNDLSSSNSNLNLQNPSSVHSSSDKTATDRPLILYAYFETELARFNLQFFLTHALHGAADFLFIFNGETDAEKLLPELPNISFLHRQNDCYDLGAFAEVLIKDDLYKKYNRFITLNASIRGPILPSWATGCWSDMYLGRLTDEVKLVGMTMNCHPVNHVQSMIWATDRIGLEILLFPTDAQITTLKSMIPPQDPSSPVPEMETPGINSCPHEYWKAVAVEVYSTPLIKAAGYKVDAMMSAFHSSPLYEEHCGSNGDVLLIDGYYGMNLHPYDTVFAKTNRGVDPLTLERLTSWMRGSKYSSYDYCH